MQEYPFLGAAETVSVKYGDAYQTMGTGSYADPTWALTNGFDQLITHLVNTGVKLNVTVNKTVTSINYTDGCTVICADGSTYIADSCISTIPAGVLKYSSPTWTPTFPAYKNASLFQLQTGGQSGGVLNKMYIFFNSTWWPTAAGAQFLGHFSGITQATRGAWSYFADMSSAFQQPVIAAYAIGSYGACLIACAGYWSMIYLEINFSKFCIGFLV